MTETPKNTTNTNPQDEATAAKKEVITKNTASSLLEESLSEVPLTPDQRIAQLTAEVRNLTNGLNQLLELSKMMMKSQIESWNSLGELTKFIAKNFELTGNRLWDIRTSLWDDIKKSINALDEAQKLSNAKIVSNQKKLAQWFTVLLENTEILGTAYYNKKDAIKELNTIGK